MEVKLFSQTLEVSGVDNNAIKRNLPKIITDGKKHRFVPTTGIDLVNVSKRIKLSAKDSSKFALLKQYLTFKLKKQFKSKRKQFKVKWSKIEIE